MSSAARARRPTLRDTPGGRCDPAEYRRLPLRAHALLANAPLHDVWTLELPGAGPERGLVDLRARLDLTRTGGAPRALFALRRALGRTLGWDRPQPGPASTLVAALDERTRAESELPPGTRDGPFTIVYAFSDEVLAELRNATVHAWSVQALVPRDGGHRFYWAIHVRPVGAITAAYMAAIDPFRRFIVYPALLRAVRRAWDTPARA